MMRQKQKPFFSTLEETELDISVLDEDKDVLPYVKTLPEPVSGPKEVRLPAATASAPPPAPPIMSETSSLPLEEVKVSPPSEETSAKPVSDPIAVKQSAIVVESLISGPFRKTAVSICDALFVYISPGKFVMGSPENEPGRGSDEMQHEVTLTRGFFLQATPVTQGQWSAEMGSNPSGFLQAGLDCPVERISWNDCQEFIRKVNKKGGYSYRLPTEAEWEYACRAGARTAFFGGESTRKRFSRIDPCLDAIGWYCGNSGKKTHPVGEKKPNAWDLYDMHGNVCEWCQDWYGKYPAKPLIDPKGATFGSGCVVRGGSWSSESQHCRSASRFYHAPNAKSDFIGFRLVRET